MKKRVPKRTGPSREMYLLRQRAKAVTLTKVDRVLADYPALLREIADDIENFVIAYGVREEKRRK